MREITLSTFVLLALTLSGQGQQGKSLSGVFHNDWLKRGELNDYEITGDDQWRSVAGMWVEESNEPANKLLFPEQVTITCTQPEGTCQELKVTLGVMAGIVTIEGPDETIWQITSWDKHGLLASYDADPAATAVSEKCHRHVLSMSFTSGAVSTSDIPTHEKGCETFKQTDSYRLVRGGYYIDTTAGNDGNKSEKREEVLPMTLGGFLQNGPKEEQLRGVCEADETRNLLNCDMYNGLRGWTISELTIAVVWTTHENENTRDYKVPIAIAPLTTEHVTVRLGLQLPADEILKFPSGRVSASKRWHWQPVGAKGYPAK